ALQRWGLPAGPVEPGALLDLPLTQAHRARQLTLFGVTRPGRTGPWSPRAVCLGSETRWPGPEQVMEKSLELLSGA
ncbi:glycosyltransferase family 9 protein, partial [Bordetella pertussis]|uniref:glycosyltransferase family 9 protein n=1 Tax=Bordetella pertussis TaxID=520 RepID=UPI000B0A17F8